MPARAFRATQFIQDTGDGKISEPSMLRFATDFNAQLLGAAQATQSSALLTLPNELVLQIFAYASPVEQLFLALTCKRLLHVASMKNLSIPSASNHRGTSCSAMLAILHIMQPLDARRRKNKSWAPCCDCYRYRPKRKSYWKIVGGVTVSMCI